MNATQTFFATHPVFTKREFAEARSGATRSPRTVDSVLAYHVRSGRLVRVRRGLYVVVQLGAAVAGADALVLASRLAPDATLAYHTALEFHGLAHTVFRRVTVISESRFRRFTYRDRNYVGLPPSRAPGTNEIIDIGIERSARCGVAIRVTRPERSMIDVLDRPEQSGGLDEVVASLRNMRLLDSQQMQEYLTARGNRALMAKTGWFLEAHAHETLFDRSILNWLHDRRPRQPVVMARGRQRTRTDERWGVTVPFDLARSTTEGADD